MSDHQPEQQREPAGAERADIRPQGAEVSVQGETDGVTEFRDD